MRLLAGCKRCQPESSPVPRTQLVPSGHPADYQRDLRFPVGILTSTPYRSASLRGSGAVQEGRSDPGREAHQYSVLKRFPRVHAQIPRGIETMYRGICSFTGGISFSLVKSAASRLYFSRSPCTAQNPCCTAQEPDCTAQHPRGLRSIPIAQLGILMDSTASRSGAPRLHELTPPAPRPGEPSAGTWSRLSGRPRD